MIRQILDATIAQVRQRVSEGDCPVTPACSVEMLEEAVLDLAAVGADLAVTGWVSPTLARCYFDVEKLRANLAQPKGSDIDARLRDLLDAIESADCELESVA